MTTINETLAKIESMPGTAQLVHFSEDELVRLARIVRAADELYHADREGGTLAERVMARDNYRKARDGDENRD